MNLRDKIRVTTATTADLELERVDLEQILTQWFLSQINAHGGGFDIVYVHFDCEEDEVESVRFHARRAEKKEPGPEPVEFKP